MNATMKRLALLMLAGLVACGTDTETTPPAVVDDKVLIDGLEGTDRSFVNFEIRGPNLYFWCHGTYGVYVTEGGNDDSGKSAAPFVVTDHELCGPG